MKDLKGKTPLLQRTYQITLRIYDYAAKFPRAQKPVIGNKILETANCILEKGLKDLSQDITDHNTYGQNKGVKPCTDHLLEHPLFYPYQAK